jgi:hypothetical protein
VSGSLLIRMKSLKNEEELMKAYSLLNKFKEVPKEES